MFSILGLGGLAAAAAFLGLVPKALEIVLILAKAFLQGFIEYLRLVWRGVSEASAGGWTVILTAFVLGYLWTSGMACTGFYGAPTSTPQSTFNQRGAVTTTPKIVTKSGWEFNWTPRDIFCYWYGCA